MITWLYVMLAGENPCKGEKVGYRHEQVQDWEALRQRGPGAGPLRVQELSCGLRERGICGARASGAEEQPVWRHQGRSESVELGD